VPRIFPNIVLAAPLRLWRLASFWHLASFDAPTVALVWSLAFAWAAHVRLPLWVPALLSLAVWSVYIADRLLDARSALRAAALHRLRERHFFHWRHRRILIPLSIASAAAAACIVFVFMPVPARERNSLLAAASLVYFTRVHASRKPSPLLSKELLVGLLFAAGCALPALSRIAPNEQLWPLILPAISFALLAWLNCHAIDRWESHSAAHPQPTIQTPATLLALTALFLAAILSSHPRSAALLISTAIAALLLALLDQHRIRLAPVTLRAAADLVLLTPILLIPIASHLP